MAVTLTRGPEGEALVRRAAKVASGSRGSNLLARPDPRAWVDVVADRILRGPRTADGQRSRHDGQQRTEVGVRPSTRLGILLRLMMAGTLMLLLVGCIEISTGSGSGGDPVDRVDQGAMTDDEKTAVDVTDTYWQRHFSELFGEEYRSPQVAGGYVGSDGPPCGGQPSVPFNAFYCTDGDFLAWDENLMAAGYEQIGDAWVYLIIAHEWAHAIQARLDRGLVSVAAELQADCLAGASLQGAARDGLVQIEPGDAEELGQTLAAVADDFPWTDESSHGNAQQRTAAFNQGANGGATACV
jgi:uncharacterized protein